MRNNVMNVDNVIRDAIKRFGDNILYECVEELNNNNIIFEYQFPFLTHIYMKDRNVDTLKELFVRYGFDEDKEIFTSAREIKGEFMYCVYIFGDVIECLEDVERAYHNYYK